MSEQNSEAKTTRGQRLAKAELIKAQIQEQKSQLSELRKKLREAEYREKKALEEQKRKDDTRRKILAGSFLLDLADKDENARNRLMSQLDGYLTQDRDRILFGLPIAEQSKNEPEMTPAASEAEHDGSGRDGGFQG